MKRTRLKRRGGLGRTAEQLVRLATGLAESGSRVEDRYWEQQLATLIDHTLADNDEEVLNAALDHLYSADSRAYDELADSIESRAECAAGPKLPSMESGKPTTSPPAPSFAAIARNSSAAARSLPRFSVP